MFSGGVEEFVRGERHRRGVKDAAGDADERNYQDEFERIDDVVAELRGSHVETKDKSYCEAKDRGAAKDGIDADEQTGCDTPGEFLWGCSHAQECQDGKSDAAVEPIVMDGVGGRRGYAEVGFAGLH